MIIFITLLIMLIAGILFAWIRHKGRKEEAQYQSRQLTPEEMQKNYEIAMAAQDDMPSFISREKYDRIQVGMTKEEIFQILPGNDSVPTLTHAQGETLETYTFGDSYTMEVITLTFSNGKLVEKQTNLKE